MHVEQILAGFPPSGSQAHIVLSNIVSPFLRDSTNRLWLVDTYLCLRLVVVVVVVSALP
jgi:hypothetical protein